MEGEKEMSTNDSCEGGNYHIITPTTTGNQLSCKEQRPYKKVVRYKECLKNHAAALGGNAKDGCGEFMPSGEQGTLDALKCSACNCHRNFHKKEIDSDSSILIDTITGSLQVHSHPPTNHLLSMSMPNQQMIVSYRPGSVPSQSDEKNVDADEDVSMGVMEVEKPKKRFRTRFTEEQKQKMLGFADKVGWKMLKLDDSVVQRFCQEIGIRRKVLKVWMHNTKHHYLQRKTHQNIVN